MILDLDLSNHTYHWGQTAVYTGQAEKQRLIYCYHLIIRTDIKKMFKWDYTVF